MSVSNNNIATLEQQLLALQEEVETLRKKNTDLNERLKAYSLINTGQISLINKLIDKVPFGVMLIDQNNTVIHANVAAGKIFNTPASEMNGQHCNKYFKCFNRGDNCPARDSEEEISLQQISSVDSDKYILHSAFVSDEGSEKIVVESFIDISEIKQAEQELIIVSKTKDEFLGMISHELRTPLNVIQGYSSLLEDELKNFENTDAASYLEKIHYAGEILLRVVNNLLELSDLTAGKIKVDHIPIDLDMIVTQLQYRLEKDFELQGNTLLFKHEDIKPFEQDLALLMKVLYELLMNANKFTENGDVVLTISIQKRDEADWISFNVSDTGCGMTEETIEQIFHAFHQADSTLTRAYEGLGLGLSLVEKIVTLINGHIEVESELGKGSNFAILLPYEPVAVI